MTESDYYLDPRVATAYDAEIGDSRAIVQDDIPFYVGLAKQAYAAGQSVLELGCGTGRVTLPIAGAGASVVGLDSSPAMLEVARQKSRGLDNVRWVEGDMARFELPERFGLVIIPFRSFQLLLSVGEQASCLRCVHDHLVEDGRLALNVANPLPVVKALIGRGRAADGPLITRLKRNLRLRYVSRAEMESLLAGAGFEIESVSGWFDGRPFYDGSSEIVWQARKR